MAIGTFGAQGPTVLIGVTALQVQTTPALAAQSHRVRCLVAAYLTWGQLSSTTAAGAPTAGVPSANTIGMVAGQTETFTFPSNSYFISTIAASFELTPGEGV